MRRLVVERAQDITRKFASPKSRRVERRELVRSNEVEIGIRDRGGADMVGLKKGTESPIPRRIEVVGLIRGRCFGVHLAGVV